MDLDQIDWIGFIATMKTWTASVFIFTSTFIALNLLKRTLLQRFTSAQSSNQTQFDQFFKDLLSKTKFFFLLSWSVFAGMAFHSLPLHIEEIARKAIFLISVLQISIWSSSVISFLIENYMRARLAADSAGITTLGLVSSLAKFGLYGMLGLFALNHFGVDITALVAGLGVGGIAVALAVQNILGDLFASLTIVLEKPFVIGDQIHTGDHIGTVEKIGLKTTRIRSVTGEELIFPNGDLLKSRIRNFKRMEERRLTFHFNVTYQTTYEKLRQIPTLVQDIIEKQALARYDRCNLKTLGLHSLEFETVFWVKDLELSTALRIQGMIQLEIFRTFKIEGIEFAYFTQPVYPKNIPVLSGHAGQGQNLNSGVFAGVSEQVG